MGRSARMGIGVGDTHTKAVATDNATYEIIGKSSVKTTHDGLRGVAVNVVKSFENCLDENGISPDDAVFVAHSTTQTTNVLIEGDVATVGVTGMTKGDLEGLLAKKQAELDDMNLGDQKKIRIVNDFIDVRKTNMAIVEDTINSMQKSRAQVLVSSTAFGVDDGGPEIEMYEATSTGDIPTAMASGATKLYGFTRRTRTAAINALILPEMLDTVNSTEGSVREVGVHIPLMIVRGDGEVMEITEMKKHPVLTMLSGPAASAMGSPMYLGTPNSVYFEVGGTTTSIGVIKNGQSAIDYSIVDGHATCISSLDMRVLGVAGGFMVQVNKQGMVDIGLRSVHIVGLDYAVFTDTDKIRGPKVEPSLPKQGGPDDYMRIRMEDGSAVTLINSYAANMLGLIKPERFLYSNVRPARKAMKALADYCGTTVEDIVK